VPQIVGQRGQAGLERGDFRAVWLFQYGAGAGGGLYGPTGAGLGQQAEGGTLALAGGDQAFADQRIIDSAIAQRIEPPVGIGGGADGIGKAQGRGDGAIGRRIAAPVTFQRKGQARGARVADKHPRIVPRHGFGVGFRIPAQCKPQELVEVVIHAFGIGDKALGKRRLRLEDARKIKRARVDGFAPLGQREGGGPARDRELRMHRMADVGIEQQRQVAGQASALNGQRVARLGAVKDAGQARRVLGQGLIEGGAVPGIEALRGKPDLGCGVDGMERCRFAFDQRDQVIGRGMAGISSGDVEGIDLGQLA
jgi:hypothetical protein